MQDLKVTHLGNYRILEKLGQGGMAAVYKAHQPAVDRAVAIKVLPPILKMDPDFANRFRQEARIIASLEHARILPVHDYGEEGDVTYLVMRFLDGGTLFQRIQKQGPLSPAEAARILRQVAEALQYAHSKNVIHRDMTSNNVMFDAVDDAYVTDFGLAKIVAGSAHLTGHSVVGTPAYISPEQAMGEQPTPRTDIYALGVVLYEMLIGDVPFHGDTPMAIIFQHVSAPLPDPRETRPDLPDEVIQVVLRAMAKDPNDRYVSALDMADALDIAVGKMTAAQAAARPSRLLPAKPAPASVGLSALRPDPTPPSVIPQTTPANPASQGELPRWVVPVGLGLVALLLIGIGFLVYTRLLAPPVAVTPAPASATLAIVAASPAPVSDTPAPTQAVIVTPTSLPAQQPPVGPPPNTSELFLSDSASLPCAENERAIFAVDFGDDNQQELGVFSPGDAAFVSLDGVWLNMSDTGQREGGVRLIISPVVKAHVTLKVAWRQGPSSLNVLVNDTPAQRAAYGFKIEAQGGASLQRGPTPLSPVVSIPPVFDGSTHVIELFADNGNLRGLIDGQVVAEGQDTDPNGPLQPGPMMIVVNGPPVSIDSMTVCDVGG